VFPAAFLQRNQRKLLDPTASLSMSGSECVAKVAWRRIWVELTRSRCRREWPLFARRRRLEWTGVDVKLPPTVARMDVAIGRRARLQGTPREGPACVPKPSFLGERKIAYRPRDGSPGPPGYPPSQMPARGPRSERLFEAGSMRLRLSLRQPRLAQAFV
jgi:hypothetical protein